MTMMKGGIDNIMELFSPSALCKAAQESDLSNLRIVLEALKERRFHPDYVFSPNISETDHIAAAPGGKCALHFAAWKGTIAAVEMLLLFGADINQISTTDGTYGQTAIFFAITRSRDDMVAFLIKNNANVKIVNARGQSPRSLAFSHLTEESVVLIEQAERAQMSNGIFPDACLEWTCFMDLSVSTETNRQWGDLDPRFCSPFSDDITAQCNRHMSDVLPRSLDPVLAGDPRRGGKVDSDLLRSAGLLQPIGKLVGANENGLDISAGSIAVSGKLARKSQADGLYLLYLEPTTKWGVTKEVGQSWTVVGSTAKASLRVIISPEAPDLVRAVYRKIRNGDTVRVAGTVHAINWETTENVEVTVEASEVILYEDDDNIKFTSSTSMAPSAALDADVDSLPKVGLEDMRSNAQPPLLPMIPPFESANHVVIVNDVNSVQLFLEAVQGLLAMCNEFANTIMQYNPWVVGVDTEWRPWLYPREDNVQSADGSRRNVDDAPVEILQLGLRNGIFILDLATLSVSSDALPMLNTALGLLLSDGRIYKLGFELGADVERVVASHGLKIPGLLRWNGAVDLNPLARIVFQGVVTKKRSGLSWLCVVTFGKALDKSQQLSPWHRRPFTDAQRTYAALDGAVLIKVYDLMVVYIAQRFPRANIDRYMEKSSVIFNSRFLVRSTDSDADDIAPQEKVMFGTAVKMAKWPRQGKEPVLE